MQMLLLVGAMLLAPLAAPVPQAGSCLPPVPVYPGALQAGGRVIAGFADWVPSTGRSLYLTPDSLLNIQRFYYTQMVNLGWEVMRPLPGQDMQSFGNEFSRQIDEPFGVLEFRRNGDREYARIVGESGGFTVALDCVV
jgi:hypothetical protein